MEADGEMEDVFLGGESGGERRGEGDLVERCRLGPACWYVLSTNCTDEVLLALYVASRDDFADDGDV